MKWLTFGKTLQKIPHGGDKRVLVSHQVPRFPEVSRVRMIGSRHQNVAVGLQLSRVGSVEKLQAVHLLEVKTQAAFRAINLKAIAVTPSDAEAAGFKSSQAAVGKPRHQQYCVVHFASWNERMLGG